MTAATRLKDYQAQAKKAEPANKGTVEANMAALGACADADSQKALILAMLGDALSKLDVKGDRVIVATYITPQVSKGGILFVDKRKDASRFEGKVGLIVAKGPTAFKYDGAFPHEGPVYEVGEWVWYRASDAPERWIADVSCRTIASDAIEGRTQDPTLVY